MTAIANPSIGEQRANRLRHAQERRERQAKLSREFLLPRNAYEEAADADS